MSEQFITLYDGNSLNDAVKSKKTNAILEQIKPQGVYLHARPYYLAQHGFSLTQWVRERHPRLVVRWAIAGDWDDPNEPGYSDGWEDCARACKGSGVNTLQLNCERWQTRPIGSASDAVKSVHEAVPDLILQHTTYGAIYAVDRDKEKPGWQNFGGAGKYPTKEFLGPGTPISATAGQWYFAIPNGENLPRGHGLEFTRLYRESYQVGLRKGDISPTVNLFAYLQAYWCRTDELCLAAESTDLTQWWAVPAYYDTAGLVAIAAMSKLHRLHCTIKEFQRLKNLKVDGFVGQKTLKELQIDTKAILELGGL